MNASQIEGERPPLALPPSLWKAARRDAPLELVFPGFVGQGPRFGRERRREVGAVVDRFGGVGGRGRGLGGGAGRRGRGGVLFLVGGGEQEAAGTQRDGGSQRGRRHRRQRIEERRGPRRVDFVLVVAGVARRVREVVRGERRGEQGEERQREREAGGRHRFGLIEDGTEIRGRVHGVERVPATRAVREFDRKLEFLCLILSLSFRVDTYECGERGWLLRREKRGRRQERGGEFFSQIESQLSLCLRRCHRRRRHLRSLFAPPKSCSSNAAARSGLAPPKLPVFRCSAAFPSPLLSLSAGDQCSEEASRERKEREETRQLSATTATRRSPRKAKRKGSDRPRRRPPRDAGGVYDALARIAVDLLLERGSGKKGSSLASPVGPARGSRPPRPRSSRGSTVSGGSGGGGAGGEKGARRTRSRRSPDGRLPPDARAARGLRRSAAGRDVRAPRRALDV